MIDRARILNAERSGHPEMAPSFQLKLATNDLSPIHEDLSGAIPIFYLAWNDVQANMPVLPQKK